MHGKQSEISSLEELTTRELDDVSGGLKNNQTEAYHAVWAGIVKGFSDAAGNVTATIPRSN
jgi:hypothetical protein